MRITFEGRLDDGVQIIAPLVEARIVEAALLIALAAAQRELIAIRVVEVREERASRAMLSRVPVP